MKLLTSPEELLNEISRKKTQIYGLFRNSGVLGAIFGPLINHYCPDVESESYNCLI
jgi:hypothetical protein